MDLGFDYFGSALIISPHKNSQTINSIGIDVQKIYTTHYLPNDFKKNQGYKRSVEMCEEYDIYRQYYCGCVYAATIILTWFKLRRTPQLSCWIRMLKKIIPISNLQLRN